MKKAIIILLALVMVLSLAACGGGSATTNTPAETEAPATPEPTEEATPTEIQFDVDNAVVETPKHIYKDAMANQARAKQTTYIFACDVGSIKDAYFTNGNLEIYLPAEELAKLNNGDSIAIIGRITNFREETDAFGTKTQIIVFGEASQYDGEVPEVAPREDEIYTGILKGQNKSYEGAWNIQIGDSNYLKLIYFAEGEDLSGFSKYNGGEKIRFTADIVGRVDNPDKYLNAKIIEVLD